MTYVIPSFRLKVTLFSWTCMLHSYWKEQWQRSLSILAPVKMYGAGFFPSMGSSAWQPYWEGENCVVAWELACFPANVHLKNNNFTSHEDHPWSHGGRGQKARPNTLLSCSFLCTPINTSTICIEAICIFGKIPQCWLKSTLYTPSSSFTAPSPVQTLSTPYWTFHCLRERKRTQEGEGKRNEGRLGVKEVFLRGLHGL